MQEYLSNENIIKDLKSFNVEKMRELSYELRLKIVDSVLNCGGHLASNLGAVEIIVALYYVFDFPRDKLIFDVGHQAYAHKLLTGRADAFEEKLRKFGGIGAFLKRSESEYDTFTTGHAGNSVSLALGLARARDVRKENYDVVAVVGDGSIVNGMSFEAFNDYETKPSKHIIVLNDNDMSISKAVGAVSQRLAEVRHSSSYRRVKGVLSKSLSKDKFNYRLLRRLKKGVKYTLSKGIVFEEFGYDYIGPIDGHDFDSLIKSFTYAKKSEQSTIIHVVTKKGKGCKEAEFAPENFHGVSEYYSAKERKLSYSDVFGNKLVDFAQVDENIVAVTSAMLDGTGLREFSQKFNERFFDVGIAEEHSISMAAGLARGGIKPYVAIYSTFLQRAVDQVIHDVALQNLPVRICVDRAGFVGQDGETHQGIFDLSYLATIPNLSILSPASFCEFEQILDFSKDCDKPLVVRYPRGGVSNDEFSNFNFGKWCKVGNNCGVYLIASGSNVLKECLLSRELLQNLGVDTCVVNASTLKPLDGEFLDRIKDGCIFVVEDNMYHGGLASCILEYYAKVGVKVCVVPISVDDTFVEQGKVDELYAKFGINAENIAKKVQNFLEFRKND